ncbi:MAG TPA: hypothetical protein VJT84_03480 [Gaiellaceae bacterium]|nr:hypothetical protein [Gaiellaceae bacterium]
MRTLALIASLLALAAVAASTAPAAPPVWVPDSTASLWVGYSLWAYENHANAVKCTGIGAGRHVAGGTDHTSFRCTVQVDGKPAGVVIAKAVGPESLKVSVVQGTFKPDRGPGPLPKGKPIMDSTTANTGLEESSWAKSKHVIQAFCSGVGQYRQTEKADLFYAFSCATIDMYGSRSVQVLVAATGARSVRVVKTFTR